LQSVRAALARAAIAHPAARLAETGMEQAFCCPGCKVRPFRRGNLAWFIQIFPTSITVLSKQLCKSHFSAYTHLLPSGFFFSNY